MGTQTMDAIGIFNKMPNDTNVIVPAGSIMYAGNKIIYPIYTGKKEGIWNYYKVILRDLHPKKFELVMQDIIENTIQSF